MSPIMAGDTCSQLQIDGNYNLVERLLTGLRITEDNLDRRSAINAQLNGRLSLKFGALAQVNQSYEANPCCLLAAIRPRIEIQQHDRPR